MSRSQRIVSLLSSATEILFALGLAEQVVGVGHECDWPAEALSRPRLTKSLIPTDIDSLSIDQVVKQRLAAGLPLYEVDAAQLTALAPDLIITQAQCDVCAVRYDDVLQIVREAPSLTKTNVLALQPKNLGDILRDVLRVGEATGASAAATAFHGELRTRIDAISAKTAELSPGQRPRVACIEWLEPLMLAANWTPELIELAGGTNLLSHGGEHSQYAQWDDVVANDPEVLIISPCGFNFARSWDEAQALRAWPKWNELAAVRDDQAFVVDGNAYLNRSGPRIVDSLEILAHAISPRLFAPPSHTGWGRLG